MSRKLRERLNVQKATRYAVIINALQILAMSGVFVYVLLNDVALLSHSAELILLGICLLIVVWGAVIDIRDAVTTRKIAEQTLMIEEAYSQLEMLNGTLRKQRHDFMNHLQVVFSLTELEEYNEAMMYIERVYGDIQRVSNTLKTSIPAVNALISAKQADCAERGIGFETEISSAWEGMPISGWELCRVFGNLIDNARDAILDSSAPIGKQIRVSLAETPSAYTFQVSNNGPRIEVRHLSSLFVPGFTTKSDGHGSGLCIVQDILSAYGGEISVQSDDDRTIFFGAIPKKTPHPTQTEWKKSAPLSSEPLFSVSHNWILIVFCDFTQDRIHNRHCSRNAAFFAANNDRVQIAVHQPLLQLDDARKARRSRQNAYVAHRLVLPPRDHSIDRSRRATHHHQLRTRHGKPIVHCDLSTGYPALFRQRNHLGIIDKTKHPGAVMPQQRFINIVGDERCICDDRSAHIDQSFDVCQCSRAKINALRQCVVIGFALNFAQNRRHFLVHIRYSNAMPASLTSCLSHLTTLHFRYSGKPPLFSSP